MDRRVDHRSPHLVEPVCERRWAVVEFIVQHPATT